MTPATQAWMRATALGGIAGTMRMTMFEFYQRTAANFDGIFGNAEVKLWWNREPPNSPDGFISVWRRALDDAGVSVVLRSPIERLDAVGAGAKRIRLVTADGLTFDADSVLLAVPPPRLHEVLKASSTAVAEGFGLAQHQLEGYFADSKYAHLGVTYIFNRELPNSVPLGGNNVRRGWHAILVEHPQYRRFLRPPAACAVTAVVSSVALDTPFLHHRLGTLAASHSWDEVARIMWDDEMLQDPTLPDYDDFEIMGITNATQIVDRGPLPIVAEGIEAHVLLATNAHGQAPFFTASLEAAIQAGNLAAVKVDSETELLPMGGAMGDRRGPLPWVAADRSGCTPQREHGDGIELCSELPASAAQAWTALVDVEQWPSWRGLVTAARGVFDPGSVWSIQLRANRTMSPVLTSFLPPDRVLCFEQTFGTEVLLHLSHWFVIEPVDDGHSVLRQRFLSSGALVWPLWRWPLRPGMVQFQELGDDLARHLLA